MPNYLGRARGDYVAISKYFENGLIEVMCSYCGQYTELPKNVFLGREKHGCDESKSPDWLRDRFYSLRNNHGADMLADKPRALANAVWERLGPFDRGFIWPASTSHSRSAPTTLN